MQVEDRLRKESFGYRAKFIQRSASEIEAKGGLEWFAKVQAMDYKSAHSELVSLTGIGPKVTNFIISTRETELRILKLFIITDIY